MKMFDAEVRTLVGVFNDAWSDNWGFVPFTQAEIDHASKAFGPVIVPELAVFVDVDDETVAFIVALTNLNEAIRDFDGKLGPINLAKLLYRLKIAGVGSTRVPLMGVKKKFRNHPLLGAGLAMIAIDTLRANGKRLGKTSAELGWILEDNKATNNIIRSVGGVHYKTTVSTRKSWRGERPGRQTTRPGRGRRSALGLRAARQQVLPGDVDRQPDVQCRRLDADHRCRLGDDQPDAGADLRGAAGGGRHPADVPVLLLRRHPGRPVRPPPLHHLLPGLDDGGGRDAGGAGLPRQARPGTCWRCPSAWGWATP